MLDKYFQNKASTIFETLASKLVKKKISADQITIISFLIGILAMLSIIFKFYYIALVFILLNRLGDGLDGAIARINKPSKFGAYLDIHLDFIFYNAIVIAFMLSEISNYYFIISSSFLLLAFCATGSGFLAQASLIKKAKKNNNNKQAKGIYYDVAFMEGGETILFFILICLWPNFYPLFSSVFAFLCFITAGIRIYKIRKYFLS